MVSGNRLTGFTFVILNLVVIFHLNQVVVEVVDGVIGVGVKRRRQELGDHGQTSVLSVDGGRHRKVLVEEVIGVPVIPKDGVGTTLNGLLRCSHVVVEGDIGLVHRTPRIAHTGAGDGIRTRDGFAVLPNLVDLRAVIKDAGCVSVSLCHDDVPVGLDDVERADFNEIDHGFVKRGLHGVEVIVLFSGKVTLDRVFEFFCELVVFTICCVNSVAFSQLPDEHGRQIVLISSQQHVTGGGNTRLEIVRNRGVFTRAQGLETVVPP